MPSLTSYIAIDPGRACGWAIFAPFGVLARCGLAKPPYTMIPTGDLVLVVEKPHGGDGKASREDLVKLARRMQMVIDHLSRATPDLKVIEIAPRRWKGTIKKSIMTRRIFERWMHPGEREILANIRASKNHNVLDAIGIGVYFAAVRGLRLLP